MKLRVLAASLLLTACSGPPWYMGHPLDGKPSVPESRARLSFRQQRAEATRARAAGQPVLELRALLALDEAQRLEDDQRARLVELLERRAHVFHALARPIAESRDLERIARLVPARGAGLLGEREAAARAAGDAWLAVDARTEAGAAYELAGTLGAPDLDIRLRALWGHPPTTETPLAELRFAIASLPLRAVGPFASVYVARGGADRATLTRALAAAHQERLDGLAARIERALAPSDADGGVVAEEQASGTADGGSDEDAAPARLFVPSNLDAWMLAGECLTARLLPLAAQEPWIVEDNLPRAIHWIDLALDEDATAPDTLALAATIYGHAHRFGGTERMLMELEYATPDRAVGLARGAEIWARVGRPRESCVQWIRAARWRDDAEDPTWREAIACARKDPGAGDWKEIRGYVIARARPERRAAVAAALDAPSP
ncbi:MAG TPA: hypothetical protein VHJ20_04810 [Polyangia bacterium]|nr:hypothetical protein [Polyangia bacterium]